jgi:superfamily II DNA or RNA helicase
LSDYFARSPRDFLAVATPGAGKTTFALSAAAELLGRRVVDRIVVVAPTEHLKLQWAEAAARAGIPIDPTYSAGSGKTSADYVGVAVTYAGVAVNPLAMRIRTERFKTLVVLDEIHHAGDALSWGEGVREAFEPATRRLALTGTPFRSDVNPIPFVTYVPGADGIPRSVADFSYGYGHALADHVVRPVLFLAYSGDLAWRTRAGAEISARLGEPLTTDLAAQALRTALDPAGEWIPSVLTAADRRLTEVRRHMPDAGGLVIASDQEAARAYAALLKKISGEAPTVVLSDEKAASRRIADFTTSDKRWMVAVRMVSEGADVPRLAVGVYATSIATPLFFAQAVGRFVRARARGETASVFVPSSATMSSVARSPTRATSSSPSRSCWPGRSRTSVPPTSCSGPTRRSARRRGSTRWSTTARRSAMAARCTSGRRRRWTSWASPACWSRTRCASSCTGASAHGVPPRRRARPRSGRPRRPPMSSWRCCAASSTAWSLPGTTAPVSPTASPTPRSARSSAARPRRSRTPTSSTPASIASASGRPRERTEPFSD